MEVEKTEAVCGEDLQPAPEKKKKKVVGWKKNQNIFQRTPVVRISTGTKTRHKAHTHLLHPKYPVVKKTYQPVAQQRQEQLPSISVIELLYNKFSLIKISFY